MHTHAMSAPSGSEEHIDDVDASQLPQQDVLIQPWTSSDRRLTSPADEVLSSAAHFSPNSAYSAPAIHPTQQNNFTSNSGQDVHHSLSVDSGPHHPSSPAFHNGQHRVLESQAASSSSFNIHHGSINNNNSRPRTILPVFGTTSKLAAHYGIPTKLPPIPRVNTNNTNHNRPPVPRFHESAPSTVTATPITYNYSQSAPDNNNSYSDFQSVMAGYLKMLNEKPEEGSDASASAATSSPAKAPAQLPPAADDAAQNMSANMLFGGANDFTGPMWEFLTSPYIDDETPFESFLDTPAAPTMPDSFQSPLVADLGRIALDPTFDDMPLLAQPGEHDFSKTPLEAAPPPPPSSTASGSASPAKPIPNFDGLYTMSPATPALEPSSVQPSPLMNDVSLDSPNPNNSRRTKKMPTGTRKNITPESLVPINAPTQPRSYISPSTTSRKAVPAVFARKRARSAAFEEEDELAGSDVGTLENPLSQAETEAIAAKRRQNTLAARRSRKRKLEYQRELEEGLESAQRERDMWKERAMMLRAQVMQLGFPDPFRET